MQVALDDVLAQVKSIERVIELRDDLVEFGRVAPKHLLNPTALTLRGSVRHIGQSGMQPILNGSVLLLVAALEQFVSDAMVALAVNLPQVIPTYQDLPNSIRSANERFTGEALRRGRARFAEYERRDFVVNLQNCQGGSTPYVLNGEAMAFNDRNMNAGTLRELISRFGIEDIWTVVGSTRSLQRWSGRGGAKVAASRAKNQLNEVIDNRNQIAHGVGSINLGAEVIRSYIQFERVLARSLVKGLEDYVVSL